VCVTHYGLAIYNKKKYLLRQKKNYGNSNISPCKNIIFKKIFFKKKKLNQKYNLQDIIITLLITNLKFQHKPKMSSFSKILILKKIDLLLLFLFIIIIIT